MKRALAAASGALLLSVALTGCITVNVPAKPGPPAATNGPTNGSDDDDFANAVTLPCNDGDIVVSDLTTPAIITGDCASVTIEGSNFDVRIEKAAGLTIRGDDNDVDVVELGSVIINGQDNDVDVSQSGIRLVEIAGNDNSVSTPGDIDGAVVNGNDNDLEYAALGDRAENGTGNSFGDD